MSTNLEKNINNLNKILEENPPNSGNRLFNKDFGAPVSEVLKEDVIRISAIDGLPERIDADPNCTVCNGHGILDDAGQFCYVPVFIKCSCVDNSPEHIEYLRKRKSGEI